MKRNNKGFTLIELLAVIVILAILVAIAIPSVTKYLNDARQGSMENEAAELVTAARTYIIANNISKEGNFIFKTGSKQAYWAPTVGDGATIDNVVQKNLVNSPYGNPYKVAYVAVGHDSNGASTFTLNLSDDVYCLIGVDESEIKGKIQTVATDSNTKATKCGTKDMVKQPTIPDGK